MLDQLASLKKERAQLEMELATYGACDPAKVEEKRRAIVLAKEAAVRWTGTLVSPFISPGVSQGLTFIQITTSCFFRTSRDRTVSRRRISGRTWVLTRNMRILKAEMDSRTPLYAY